MFRTTEEEREEKEIRDAGKEALAAAQAEQGAEEKEEKAVDQVAGGGGALSQEITFSSTAPAAGGASSGNDAVKSSGSAPFSLEMSVLTTKSRRGVNSGTANNLQEPLLGKKDAKAEEEKAAREQHVLEVKQKSKEAGTVRRDKFFDWLTI